MQNQFKAENQSIGNLLQAFLQNFGQSGEPTERGEHLDEDALSSFVEGNLNRQEAAPLVEHLVGCSPCRGITAHLARLTQELDETPELTAASNSQPNRLRDLLSGIVNRNFSFGDEAVFAHNEKQDETGDPDKNGHAELPDENKS